MTPEEIKRARKLCDAATPGPWEQSYGDKLYRPYNRVCKAPCGGPDVFAIGAINIPDDDVNSKFIAQARTLLPQCLDEIERLQNEVKNLRLILGKWDSTPAEYKLFMEKK